MEHLLFRVGTVDLALPAGQVSSILPDPVVVPIPVREGGLTGLLPLSGAPRYVLDLRVRFALEPSTPHPVAIVLSHYQAVLLVDTVLDSVRIAQPSIRTVPHHPAHIYRKYATGVWRARSRPCFLLDLPALLPAELALTQSPVVDLSARHSVPRIS